MKKLKNILLATTFGLSFGISKGYSHETSRKLIDHGEYYYCLNGKSYKKLWSKWSDGTMGLDDIRTPQNDNDCQENSVFPKTTQDKMRKKGGQYELEDWKSNYYSTPGGFVPKNSLPQNKPSTNYNYFTPKTNKNFDLNNALNTALVVGGAALILNELFKPRNKAPVNNFSNNYNSPAQPIYKSPSESSWDWQDKKSEESLLEKKSGVIKRVDEDFWGEIKDKKLESKKIANERSKELSDFVEKQIEYSPKTKKWFDEEVKKADEFYKEFYKADPKAYAEAQKLDDLHKVISYNAYQSAKDYTAAGPVMEGMETYNEIKEKGMKNYWKDEIKSAEEFYKEKGYSVETSYKVVGTGVKGYKAGGNIQNPITIDEKIRKVIGYEVYKKVKEINPSGAGTVIEIKEKYFPEKATNWWDK